MADLSLVTDNFLPTASETFTDNLSGSIAAGATTVPVNSAVEYADGEVVVLTVDPGTSNEATFVGVKDTGADQFIECIWTEGNTSVGHDAGATIIDYDSATHYNLLSKALQGIMNQDGTLKDDPIRTALGLSDASQDGWEVFPYTMSVNSGYNKGQKEFELTVANQDVTTLLSPGMRLRVERSTAAPTQCADFEASSSQYASKSTPSGITFTDDFTCEAWIKLESYTAGYIVCRLNSGLTNGWGLNLESNGVVTIRGLGSSDRRYQSYQSVPLGKWVHIAASLDMSTNSGKIYLNGVEIPSLSTGSTGTSLIQSGDLVIGNRGGSSVYFDGKISDVRVWSTVRSASEIRDNMNQHLTGSETNLVAYFPLNGNFEDLTSNNNDLTASGGATATDTDNPLKDTEYAIITKVEYSSPNSIVTVFTGTDHNIPNMTLDAPFYSTQKVPFGFPASRGKWLVESLSADANTVTAPNKILGLDLQVPIGEWVMSCKVSASVIRSAGTAVQASLGISTSPTAFNDPAAVASTQSRGDAQPYESSPQPISNYPVSLAAQTTYYAVAGGTLSSWTNLNNPATGGSLMFHRLVAECAYL